MSHLPLETKYKVVRKLCIGGNYICLDAFSWI